MTLIGGRYTLLEQIGSGAMGVVWKARDEVLHREVAVKQLQTPDQQRAMREARNAARLHHQHAIAVFDVIISDDEPWLIMEYLPSRSLSAVIAEDGPVEPAEAARIGGHVASALAAAHAAGIVHRDIKPGNVLIGHDGTVKITDFGISRATGDGTLTETGMIAGTPAYLAPEVARGENPDTASDVFSLGAMLFAAVEGQSPFGPSENSFGLIYRAASGKVQEPTKAGPLTSTLRRLLAVEACSRPSAQEAAALLGAEPPAKPVKVKKKRRLLAPVLAAVALLAATGATAVIVWPTGPPSPSEAALFTPEPRYYSPNEAMEFVSTHFTTLLSDRELGFDNLAPAARKDRAGYLAHWSRFKQIDCCSPMVVSSRGPNWIVEVQLTLDQEPGRYDIEVAAIDNQMKIVSSARK